MSDLPDPMSPPDCDLRGYDFMPLFGNRLFGSSLYAKALRNPRAGLAALKLWWAAWQQCPAGSLPSDDDSLCYHADFGTDIKAWMKVKEIALHGFVQCSDGRLYHRILCDEAKDAFERRRKERERKANLRAKKSAETNGGNDSGETKEVPPVSRGTTQGRDAGQDADVRADRTGQDSDLKEEKKDPPSLRSVPPKRRERLRDDWAPSEAGEQFAEARGVDARTEAQKFRDHHTAKGNLMADWDAAWRTWCGNAQRFAPRAKPIPGQSPLDLMIRAERMAKAREENPTIHPRITLQ
jgi:hypothetical protein